MLFDGAGFDITDDRPTEEGAIAFIERWIEGLEKEIAKDGAKLLRDYEATGWRIVFDENNTILDDNGSMCIRIWCGINGEQLSHAREDKSAHLLYWPHKDQAAFIITEGDNLSMHWLSAETKKQLDRVMKFYCPGKLRIYGVSLPSREVNAV